MRLGAPLLKAHFPRAFLDVNREAYELDPRMFAEPLPPFVNSQSARVAGGLGTVPRLVGEGQRSIRGAFRSPKRSIASKVSTSLITGRLMYCFNPRASVLAMRF